MYERRQLQKTTEVLVGGALMGMGCRYDKFGWPRRSWASGMQLRLEEPLGFDDCLTLDTGFHVLVWFLEIHRPSCFFWTPWLIQLYRWKVVGLQGDAETADLGIIMWGSPSTPSVVCAMTPSAGFWYYVGSQDLTQWFFFPFKQAMESSCRFF